MYLTGATQRAHEAQLIRAGCGLMLNPASGYALDTVDRFGLFAIDNGCFSTGDAFDPVAWIQWVTRYTMYRRHCLFVVAPDVVGDAAATVARSRPWLPVIRALGFPAAFVGQDGQEHLDVPWDEFDCWFTGGSTEWKLGDAAHGLAIEAKRRGKWLHMGRVNSWRRLSLAADRGYDSADGTYTAFGPDRNVPRLASWMHRIRTEPRQAQLFEYMTGATT